MKKIGILALQGCVEPHQRQLAKLGCSALEVRQPKDLQGLGGLILPGGESTTMIRLAKLFDLWLPLKDIGSRIPFWGVCAGSILMAKEVENPGQESLGVMDIRVKRNAYGRQVDSFQDEILVGMESQQAVFIRAPKFVSWGASVRLLGSVKDGAVFLEDARHMVTSFHPELGESPWCHEIFLKKVEAFGPLSLERSSVLE